MNTENQTILTTKNRKHRKDFLYNIAKLKQNQILCEKKNGQEQYQQQNEKQENEKQKIQFQKQFDFQFQVPQFQVNQTRQAKQQKNNSNKTNEITKITKISKKFAFQEQEQKIIQEKSKENKTTIFNQTIQLNEFQSQVSNINQNFQRVRIQRPQTIGFNKPFTFTDFDQQQVKQIQKQQQNNSQNEQNNMINKHENINQNQIFTQQKSQQPPCQSSSENSDQQLKGVSLTSNCLEGNVMIKITNKSQLIHSKLPPGIILKCIIRRSSDIFNPQYDFYLNNGLKHLISAKKYSLAKRQIFKLSLELSKFRNHDIIGVIMANTVHNTYWAYKQLVDKKQLEYQIKAIIKYQKIIKESQRQMKVHLFIDKRKQTKINQNNLIHQISEQGDLILQNYQYKQKQNSTKNYRLCDYQDKQYQYLKLKKISDHLFQVQIQHPLSPLQAFAISLTRFDAELK